MKKRIIIAFLVAALGISAMAYAGAQLTGAQRMYQEGDAAYDEIFNSVRQGAGAGDGAATVGGAGGGTGGGAASGDVSLDRLAGQQNGGGGVVGEGRGDAAGSPEAGSAEEDAAEPFVAMVDFDTLRTINSDAAAWLYSPDTVIDYPVMAAEDYTYYLGHLPDGTKNANGTLFIDYNNAPDFSGGLTVIYGHHMKSGRMFGGLVGYKDQKYFEEHPYMYLYTDHANYRIDLIYGSVVGAEEWAERAFMYEENVSELLEFAGKNTTFKSDVQYEEGDRVVVLSTCSYEFSEARYFVLGVLRGI